MQLKRILPFLFLTCCGLTSCSDDDKDGSSHWDCSFKGGVVTDVTDGDTIQIKVLCDSDEDCCYGSHVCDPCGSDGYCSIAQPVRFMGINTPEIPHGRPDDKNECLGQAALKRVKDLILDKEVELVFEDYAGCHEKYGRWLAYIVYDGQLIQETLLKEGLACLFWYSNERWKDLTLYYDRLVDAHQSAVDNELGIFSSDDEICEGLPKPDKSKCSLGDGDY